MIWNLDTPWLLMAIATVVVLSFFFGSALDYLMRDDGFGSTGNMMIVSTGFFLGIVGANQQGYDLHELHRAVVVGHGRRFRLPRHADAAQGDARPLHVQLRIGRFRRGRPCGGCRPALAPLSRRRFSPVSFSLFESLRPSGPSTSGWWK